MNAYAEVVFPIPLSRSFVYRIPESLGERAKAGVRAAAPLGKRNSIGFIVGIRPQPPAGLFPLKEIQAVLDDAPLFSSAFLSFTKKLSSRHFSSWGEMLQASCPPSSSAVKRTRVLLTEAGARALGDQVLRKKEKEAASLLLGRRVSPLFLQKKLRMKSVSSLVRRLEKKGYVRVEEVMTKTAQATLPGTPAGLSKAQLALDFGEKPARKELSGAWQALSDRVYSQHYLFGSASSREQAYLELMRKAVSGGGKVLYLCPEISLTEDVLEGFRRSWPGKTAVFHSRLTVKQREAEWRKIREGRMSVIAGPRSALFLPVSPLRLVIVDDEHDDSYIQNENPAYDARIGARLRAEAENAALVFGSMTPSVDAFYRAQAGGYLVQLDRDIPRAGVQVWARGSGRGIISKELMNKIGAAIDSGGSAIVFLNRRGYAVSLICPSCRNIPRCPKCDIPFVYHKKGERLVCHHCGDGAPQPERCPECGRRLLPVRGAGIQAVEEELRKAFPSARVARFDTDVAGTKKDQDRIIAAFRRKRVQLLIGTHLLARRPGVPRAAFIAVLYPETVLGLSDYRAAETVFHSVTRTLTFLRDDPSAEGIILTDMPAHHSISSAAARDFLSFYKEEIKLRKLMNYPPFSEMAEISFQARDQRALAARSREFLALIKPYSEGLEVFGPTLSTAAGAKGLNRIQFILKAAEGNTLSEVLFDLPAKMRGKNLSIRLP